MEDYESIFKLRGSSYDLAMRQYPNARDEEFEQLISRAGLKPGEIVADVPAGGGYLRDYLPNGCQWLGHEPCTSFTIHKTTLQENSELLPLPWGNASVDVVMSLAGVHHIIDKRPLFIDLYRVTKPGGRFVLSDVATDSPPAYFLDDYVGKYNSTGHQGIFLDDATTRELQEAKWIVQESEQVKFHWKFADLEEMERFCNQLFDIQRVEKGQTIQAIKKWLSVTRLADGSLGMNWSLRTIVSEK